MKDVRLRYEHIRKRERRALEEKTTDEATASESELEKCLVPDTTRHSSESDAKEEEVTEETVPVAQPPRELPIEVEQKKTVTVRAPEPEEKITLLQRRGRPRKVRPADVEEIQSPGDVEVLHDQATVEPVLDPVEPEAEPSLQLPSKIGDSKRSSLKKNR